MKYSKEEYWVIMDTTQSTYAHMLKRLTRRMNVSNWILIYYSTILIIYSLTSKYYGNFMNKDFIEYIGIIISVIMLAYSLINNNANYSNRIDKIQKSMTDIIKLKRELSSKNLEDIKERYELITSITEVRNELDFYLTAKSMNKESVGKENFNYFKNNNTYKKHKKKIKNNNIKENGLNKNKIKEIKIEKSTRYLNEIDCKFYQQIKWIGEYIVYFLLFIAPIIILILSFIFKQIHLLE